MLALPFAWLLFVVSRALGHVERSRIDALLDVRIADPVPPLTAQGRLRPAAGAGQARARAGGRSPTTSPTCRSPSIGFALIDGGVGRLAGDGVLPAYVDELPGDSAKFYFFEVTAGGGAGLAAVVGVVGLVFVAPWVTIGVGPHGAGAGQGAARAERRPGPRGPGDPLETSRTAAVDSAEAERRRIERDLHDGAQQRLVALAADLGAAREKLDRDDPRRAGRWSPTPTRRPRPRCKEIRDLVRGIHPVILEDRGLDAALSAVVARSPVPVALDVARRPSARRRRSRARRTSSSTRR